MDLQNSGTGTSGNSPAGLAALVVHADTAFCGQLAASLAEDSIHTEGAESMGACLARLGTRSYDAIIVDESLEGTDGPFWEQLALRMPPSTALYLVTERATPQVMGQFHTRIKALFHKPFETDVLLSDLKAYIREKKLYGAKRKSDRIPMFAEATFYALDGKLFSHAMLLNLSVGGFFAVLPRGTNLPENGERLKFSIRIPGEVDLAGQCQLQWRQTEGSVGCGVEFYAPSAESIERVCVLLNSLRTRQLGSDLRAPVRISDLAALTARVQGWLESRPLKLTDFACVCDTEITCFAPLLVANLAGVVRGFGANCCREGAEIALDVVVTELAAEFILTCAESTVNLESMIAFDKLMPKLQLAGGGREMLALHNANVNFTVREGGPVVSLRVPLRQRR